MKNCPYCNEALKDTANFCHNCGEKYKAPAASIVLVEKNAKKPTKKEIQELEDIFCVKELPDGTYSISDGVGSFEDYEVPSFVSEIGSGAFSEIEDLNEITIGENVKYIDIDAFENSNLDILNITLSQEAMESISSQTTNAGLDEVFPYVTEFNVTISDSATVITERLFATLGGITEIDIPDSVEVIEMGAFGDCCDLENVYFGNSVRVIGANAFESCAFLQDVTFPDSLEIIEENAFASCCDFTELNFPDNLKKIGDNAFYDCSSVESVYFGKSVETVSVDAFDGCYDITYVSLRDDTPLKIRDLVCMFPDDCEIERLDN